MSRTIFRQKNLDRLAAPDNLNEYLKVVTPSDWAVLLAVCLVLIGLFIWCLVGNLERRIESEARVKDGVAYFSASEALTSGLSVKIGDTESLVRDVGKDLEQNKFIGAALVTNMADGVYKASIVVEQITPLDALFN